MPITYENWRSYIKFHLLNRSVAFHSLLVTSFKTACYSLQSYFSLATCWKITCYSLQKSPLACCRKQLLKILRIWSIYWRNSLWKTLFFCGMNVKLTESSLEVHSEPFQTSKIERSAKIVHIWKPLTIFTKSSILSVWQCSEYASGI